MKALLLSILLSPLIANSQSLKLDSAKYYQKEIFELTRKTFDSLRKTERYITAKNRYDFYRSKSNNYTGPVILFDILHSNYNKFNSSIAQDGFPKLNDLSFRIGFGISNKTDKVLLDLYFGILGFTNNSTKPDEKIKFALSNLFQLDFGYDLLNSNIISLYPYAGLSARISSLTYIKSGQTNPNYTNVTNILSNSNYINESSARLGYQAGLGLDLLLANNKAHTTGEILFIKAGINNALWKDSYKISGIKYDPEIKQGDWQISFGIKFINRR